MTKSFAPMLSATVLDTATLPYPLLVSPKLDGIRAMVRNGVLVSRNLKPIPNLYCQSLFACEELEGCDGELIVGSPTGTDVWNRSQSGVMRKDGEPDVTFHIFDNFDFIGGYSKRIMAVHTLTLSGLWPMRAKIVTQTPVMHAGELAIMEERFVKAGYEGAMLRKMAKDVPYKFGRSTLREAYLMKLVRKHTMEGVVVGLVEQMHNGNALEKDNLGRAKRSKVKAGLTGKDTLGALVLTTPGDPKAVTIDTFEVGTGFDDKTRAALWSMGKKLHGAIVKIEYRELTPDGKPRFPVFLGLRDKRDMDVTHNAKD